ncbi:MAG: molecular chaperone TorD family protein [Candidatus Thiodiazotropha endolucinida]|uniref:Chaperone protein TorD n=1 Tax=Candidatus Thiodiazotropha endolucinida TaxID=1655433 RepID=A0A7Z1ADR4_9GAMM|nr:molecular chaperone TorD family protein [Candidatus Thiodiazotropha endolucinida]ODJ85648.1 chaperone protein TorD [Candidatus Thiodiazotropha endolucinida]
MGIQQDQQDNSSIKLLQTFYNAVADDLEMLALLHQKEPDSRILEALLDCNFPHSLGLKLVTEAGSEAIDLMSRVIKSLPEVHDDDFLDELAADYADIYLNHGLQASPLESVWLDEENLTCQESMFQVRVWYEMYGLMAENWRVRPDDDLVLQLQFISHLFANSESEKHLQDVAKFMDEHLLRWLNDFSNRVASRCATPYFAGVALLTSAYCEELRDLLVVVTDQPRPSQEEIEERMKSSAPKEDVSLSYMPGMGPAV